MRTRTSSASICGPPVSGAATAAAVPGTRRADGGSSSVHGVTHSTVYRSPASGPSADRSTPSAASRSRPAPPLTRTRRNSRVTASSAEASSASSAPIRPATRMAAASWASVGPGSGSSSQTYPWTTSRERAGRQIRPRSTPASGAGGIRTGPVARAMPKPSNQALTCADELRARIVLVRTGSSAASSPRPSCTPKAIRPKSRPSRVAGTPSRAEISSTSSW